MIRGFNVFVRLVWYLLSSLLCIPLQFIAIFMVKVYLIVAVWFVGLIRQRAQPQQQRTNDDYGFGHAQQQLTNDDPNDAGEVCKSWRWCWLPANVGANTCLNSLI